MTGELGMTKQFKVLCTVTPMHLLQSSEEDKLQWEDVCRVSVCHLLNHTLFSHSQPQIQPRSLVRGHTAPRSVPSPSNPRLPTHLVSATRSTPAHSSLRSQNREQPPVHNLFSCFVLIFCIYTCQRCVCWLAAFNL